MLKKNDYYFIYYNMFEFLFGKQKKTRKSPNTVKTPFSKKHRAKYKAHGKSENRVIKKGIKCIQNTRTNNAKKSCVKQILNHRDRVLKGEVRFAQTKKQTCKAFACNDTMSLNKCNKLCLNFPDNDKFNFSKLRKK